MNLITSAQNPLVKQWRQLQQTAARKARGLFLAEGEHLVMEAGAAGAIETLLVEHSQQARYQDMIRQAQQVVLVSPQVIKALSDSKTPQGILAVCRLPASLSIAQLGPCLVALNRLQDPGNVGTILRTMDAAGFHALILDPGCADPFSPKALRASMGAVFRVPVCHCDHLSQALQGLQGYQLVAGDLQGQPFFDHPGFGEKVCFLIGNEGAGLSWEVARLAHHRLKLPIRGGAESLNAAVAASIMMYDHLRRNLSRDLG